MIPDEPAESWDFYLTNIHDRPASIAVDLGLSSAAPMKARPWLVWAQVPMATPRPDGLAYEGEADALAALEEALAAELKASSGARQVGRLTTRGRRELFFYAESTIELEASIAKVGAAHAPYELRHVARRDPDWTAYREVLLPEPEEAEWMRERDTADDALEAAARGERPNDA